MIPGLDAELKALVDRLKGVLSSSLSLKIENPLPSFAFALFTLAVESPAL